MNTRQSSKILIIPRPEITNQIGYGEYRYYRMHIRLDGSEEPYTYCCRNKVAWKHQPWCIGCKDCF